MQVYDNPNDLSRVFKLSNHELATIESQLPIFMARKMADKFVEENWPKVKANKALMKKVRELVVEQSTTKITELVAQRVTEVLDTALPTKEENLKDE